VGGRVGVHSLSFSLSLSLSGVVKEKRGDRISPDSRVFFTRGFKREKRSYRPALLSRFPL